MSHLLRGSAGLDWQAALRRAALAAPGSRRGFWLAGLGLGAAVACLAVVLSNPSGPGSSSAALSDARQVVEQSGRLTGGLPGGATFVPSFPLWTLLLARFSPQLELAARLLSGLSAVFALFMAYQLCHALSNREGADQQSVFALLALALSPTFVLATLGSGTETPHLALLLWALLCVQRALGAESGLVPMALAGLLVGLSLLMRPVSVLVPLAVGLWLWRSRPFDADEPAPNLRAGLTFAAGFALGAAPRLLLSLTTHTSALSWGPAEAGLILSRLLANPISLPAAAGTAVFQYLAADDLDRLAAAVSAWQSAAWGSALGGIIALAPTILKLLGVLGLLSLCWVEHFEVTGARTRLLAILLALLVLGGSLGLVDERNLLPIWALLVIFAFAGLPTVLPGAIGGLGGLALLVLLVFNQLGAGYSPRLSAAYRTSERLTVRLRTAGAIPGRVMSASWTFYDTSSSRKERYRPIPLYVDSAETLVRAMRREGTRYLVFDRQAGAALWPRLAPLVDSDTAPAGLRPLQPPLQTDDAPPNLVAIYALE
jgi:hypothetical protein